MNIHEFQAKQLLARHGVALNEGAPASSVAEARTVAEGLVASGHRRMVVKAQIHAGGRGKGTFRNGFQGGVKLVESADEAGRIAEAMLGQVLVTKQTGPDGRVVRRLLIEAAPKILREYYVAVLLDRAASVPVLMASTEGGVDIEEVAAQRPEKIVKVRVHPLLGLQAYQARGLAAALGFSPGQINAAALLFMGVYDTWWNTDATLVEINPLALVEAGDAAPTLVAVDAKIGLDDNALPRHPDLLALRDLEEESPLEVEAGRHQLNYIKLDGTIACLVNGAGLAMATMDIIQHYGGQPANFLDVGGGASPDQVTAAFRIVLQDPNVKAILVNIFGGIMDCDVIARGVVAAAREARLDLPLVVRLEGNNVQAGQHTLAQSGLAIVHGDSMADAAQRVVAAARAGRA